MALDKLVDSTQLDADLTSVANAIRTKGGTSAQLAFPAGFVQAIGSIPSGGGIDMPTFTVTFDSDEETILSVTCDKTFVECEDFINDDGMTAAKVTIAFYDGTTQQGVIPMFSYIDGAEITYTYYDWFSVTYTPNSLTGVSPSVMAETLNATENGTYYPMDGYFTEVNVAVPTGTARSSSDLTVNNLTVTAPAGLYAEAASKTLTDANLSAGNIKKDVTIFGVTGSFEGGGGGGGSSYTLLHSEEVTVSTTSTTVTNVKTIKLDTGWTAEDIIYIRIRDKAGKRNGYFYGSDNFVINAYAKNGQTGDYQNVLKHCWRYSNDTYGVRSEAGTSP